MSKLEDESTGKLNRFTRLLGALGRIQVALAVLALMALLTFVAWRYTLKAVEADSRSRFEGEINKAKETIREHVEDYVAILYGARGLFALHEEVGRAEWKSYIESLDLQKRYPGFHDIIFARYLPKEDKEAFERRIEKEATRRRTGYSSFVVFPVQERAAYYPIEFAEPPQAAAEILGFDIGSDPIRLAAVEEARDSGEPVSTGRIVLISPPKVGFAIRLPIYRKGASVRTVEERRTALLGFVSSAYDIDEMMRRVFGDNPSRDFDFEIYDGGLISSASPFPQAALGRLLYDDDRIPHAIDPMFHARHSQFTTLKAAGRLWIVHFSTRPNFSAGPEEQLPLFVLLGGGIITLLLFGVFWSLGVSRSRAVDLANAMTADFRERGRETRLLQEITVAISASDDFHSALGIALRKICEATGWKLGQAWIPSRSGLFLESSPQWHGAVEGLDKFRKMNVKFKLGSGEDLPGRAWFSKSAVWSSDVTADANFSRGLIAQAAGIKAGMAIPALAGTEVVAVVEFFMLEPREEDKKLIDLVSAFTAQLGAVIQRKRVEAEIRRSEERYRTLVEQASDGIFIADLQGALIEVNTRGCAMLGFSREELLRMRLFDLVPSEDLKTNPLTMEGKGGGAIMNVRRMKRKKGSSIIVEVSAKMLSDERFLAIVRDITERRLMEEALAENERKYRDLVEMSSDVIWGIDAEGKITFVNQAAKRVYGYEPREMVGRRLTDFQVPPRAEQDLKRFTRGGEEGISYQYESQIVRKDGSLVWLSANGISLYDGEGRFSGATGISRDITERKRTEEILADRENLLKTIFDTEPECVKLVSANGAVLNINRAGLMMIEADHLDQIIGKSVYPLIDPKYRSALKSLNERVFQGESGGLEFELIGLKGTRRWLETRSVPLRNPKGEIVALLGVMRDVTARRAAEEEVRGSREQLRSLSTRLQLVLEEERARIAREVHDELGQLLTVLKMELSWLVPQFYEEQAPLREKVCSMSQLVDTTIETVRKIATELRPGVLDDLGLIAAIEWQAQEFQSRTGVQCKLDVAPESMSLDSARSTAIFRILQEALTNVVRHAQANKISIHLARGIGDVVLEVSDNGKGIREDQMTDPKSLGLLGMRERALLWGGEVQVRGVKDTGTTVTVRIPTHEVIGESV